MRLVDYLLSHGTTAVHRVKNARTVDGGSIFVSHVETRTCLIGVAPIVILMRLLSHLRSSILLGSHW